MTIQKGEYTEQHPIGKSIFLHVYTGAIIMLFAIIMAPFILKLGFPPVFGIILGFILIGEPLQLGYMLYQGRKRNGKLSLKGVILNQQPIPVWQYIVIPFLLVIFSFALFFLTLPLNNFLANTVFSWLPDWLLHPDPLLYTKSSIVLWMMFLFFLLIDGIINPIIEELYWRGYLQPRISRFGIWSPIITAVLFSIQHFWQPYNIVFLILLNITISYIVWRKKNVYISIITHVALNTVFAFLTFMFLFT